MGQVMASPTTCALCGQCERQCPIGAIEIFAEIVHVCDLCGGSPRCVQACTEGAIQWVPGETGTVSLEAVKKETGKLNPSERRAHYIKKMGRELRKKWGGEK
jgi:MinD superfamily P-loop ATPase